MIEPWMFFAVMAVIFAVISAMLRAYGRDLIDRSFGPMFGLWALGFACLAAWGLMT